MHQDGYIGVASLSRFSTSGFMSRTIFLNLLASTLLLGSGSTDVLTLVKKSCVSCHSTELKSGDLDLKTLAFAENTFVREREIWEKVLEKLQTKQMPPPPLPPPSTEVVATVTRWLRDEFARQDSAIQPRPGRVSAWRLNRVEYNHTIRD